MEQLYKASTVPPQVRVLMYCAKISLSSTCNWLFELPSIAPMGLHPERLMHVRLAAA
jgi:hypothetical protein